MGWIHFYRGKYTGAIHEILDEDKKTIIHIPSVNSGELEKEKYEEVKRIIDSLGKLDYQDPVTGVLYLKSKDTGRTLKIADLVNDN